MPEKIPWELMRDCISGFTHDLMSSLSGFTPALLWAGTVSKNPGIKALYAESVKIIGQFHKVSNKFRKFRNSNTEPKNLDARLLEYRKELAVANRRVDLFIGKLEGFLKRHGTALGRRTIEPVKSARDCLVNYRDRFPASQLGKLPEPILRPVNIHGFLKSFSAQKLVDRNGNPVKVVLKGKDIGNAAADPGFLHRGMSNLVTDALNHTPGRPITVELSKKGGHIAIDVTNKGPKLLPEEIGKIGRVRFTRAMHDPNRGFGKISTRILTEAQGGRFEVGNSRIGPKLSIHLPATRRR